MLLDLIHSDPDSQCVGPDRRDKNVESNLNFISVTTKRLLKKYFFQGYCKYMYWEVGKALFSQQFMDFLNFLDICVSYTKVQNFWRYYG